METKFVKRPGFNATGKAISLPVNSYEVTKIPNVKIYQYDVTIGNGAEKRIVHSKVWNTQARKDAVGNDIIYDGNKLAWSIKLVGKSAADNNARFIADLNVAEGRPARSDGKNSFRVTVNQSKVLNIATLEAFLQGKLEYHSDVLEAINFLDHLMRETPFNDIRLIQVKRSFFRRQGERAYLGNAVEVFRGVYQSIRPAQGGKMVVNLDVANTTFWRPQSLLNTMVEKEGFRDIGQLAQRLRQDQSRRAINRWLKKLSVTVKYNGNKNPNKIHKMDKINDVTANSHRIKWRNPQTGEETNEMVTVTAYFRRRYNVNLQYPDLPLVLMNGRFKGTPIYFPPELLHVVENQRYAAKLDEAQTANMIKFAVSPPNVRLTSINNGKSWLEWDRDPLFKQYGLSINNQPMVTQARILPNPSVRFKNKAENPGTKGRWDLRGKVFINGNPEELKSWGVGIFPGRTNLGKADLEKFAMDFTKAYRGHGGRVANALPHVMPLNADAGNAVQELFQATGNKFQLRPQMLVFIVQDSNSQHYLRIKKSCDIRFGVVSQILQARQVQKGNPQYYSNVLMKFNAKLGGATAQVEPGKGSGSVGTFTNPTVFIGADVSHASPGSDQPSMTAMTVSFDRIAARYAAGCQTNGYRVEMITETTIRNILGPLLTAWMSNVGGGKVPSQVYYMRDGVSEGQFIQVVREELPAIRAVMDKLSGGKWTGKITVIIAAKRHHIRAFPKQGDGDPKGNPQPGTLIERDVTSPQEFDFYLYSHIALQGTSRPVHYTVLVDEANHSPAALQNMVYEHCYQYMRSTTSVSLHPAVYYAHLASNRAKAHENIPASAGLQGGAGFKQNQSNSSDTPRSSDAPKLLDMANASNPAIRFSMWYI